MATEVFLSAIEFAYLFSCLSYAVLACFLFFVLLCDFDFFPDLVLLLNPMESLSNIFYF